MIEEEGQEVLRAGDRLASQKSCVECQEKSRLDGSNFAFSLGSLGRIERCPVTSSFLKKDIWSLVRSEQSLANEQTAVDLRKSVASRCYGDVNPSVCMMKTGSNRPRR